MGEIRCKLLLMKAIVAKFCSVLILSLFCFIPAANSAAGGGGAAGGVGGVGSRSGICHNKCYSTYSDSCIFGGCVSSLSCDADCTCSRLDMKDRTDPGKC